MLESPNPVSTSESLTLRERLKSFLRPVLLAGALGATSLVSIGCDKSNSSSGPSQEKPTTSQVTHEMSPAGKEMLRDEIKQEQGIVNMEDAEIGRAKELAMEAGVKAEDLAQIKITAVGEVPIQIFVHDQEVPLKAEYFSPKEIHQIQSAYRLSQNPATAQILSKIGIPLSSGVQQENGSSKPSADQVGGRQGPDFPAGDFGEKPTTGVRQGNDYDKNTNDW